MRPFLSASKQFFRQIWADAMLSVLLLAPLVMGLAFRFGVPLLEAFICAKAGKDVVLAPYYPVLDLLLAVMTPVMFSAAGALVILDEADSGVSRVYITSPVGTSGYLLSRIGVPAVLATVYCVLVTAVFQLSGLGLGRILLVSLCSGTLSVTVALMIPSLAKNRVEGMAVSKLSGLLMLGLPAALLLPSPLKYAAGILPSFWMTELVMGGGDWNIIPALFTSVGLSVIFLRKFSKRVL